MRRPWQRQKCPGAQRIGPSMNGVAKTVKAPRLHYSQLSAQRLVDRANAPVFAPIVIDDVGRELTRASHASLSSLNVSPLDIDDSRGRGAQARTVASTTHPFPRSRAIGMKAVRHRARSLGNAPHGCAGSHWGISLAWWRNRQRGVPSRTRLGKPTTGTWPAARFGLRCSGRWMASSPMCP